MFENITNISEIVLSDFDFSRVTSIRRMFSGSSLKKMNFRYVKNASSLNNMEELFLGCNNLESISFNNLDTSKVTTMKGMFNGCSNLKNLDLSKFISSSITTINSMFKDCSSLINLNLNQFKLNSSVNKGQVFDGINPNINYCIEDTETNKYLNITSNCSQSCSIDSFVYNNICYNKCPKNTYPILYDEDEYDENDRECFDDNPQGYYLDINNEVYKNCYETCNKCKNGGNITNNNCEECISNYMFYTNSLNISICYEICNNYYYFDKF